MQEIYSKNPTKWWNGYDGQRTVILNDFKDGWRLDTMLKIMDQWPMDMEYKGGVIAMSDTTTQIIVTSVLSPREWFDTYAAQESAQNPHLYTQVTRRLAEVIHITELVMDNDVPEDAQERV